MSQIIEILEHHIQGYISCDKVFFTLDGAEAAINAYIAEVIGSNDKYPKLPNNSGMYSPELITRNKLRAEQRKRAGIIE